MNSNSSSKLTNTYLKQTHSQQLNTTIRSLCSDSWYSKIGFVLMTSYAKNFNFEEKIFDSNTTWQCDADYHNMKTYNFNIFSHLHSLVVMISIDNVWLRLFNKYYSRHWLLTGIEYCRLSRLNDFMNTNIFSHIHSLSLLLFLTQIVIEIEYCRPSRLNYFIEVKPTPKHNIDRRLMISSKPNVQGNRIILTAGWWFHRSQTFKETE